MNIDTTYLEGDTAMYITFSGCGKSFKYLVKPAWHYNCYPVYDYWGSYLYDDCYWEYYPEFNLETDSLVSSLLRYDANVENDLQTAYVASLN